MKLGKNINKTDMSVAGFASGICGFSGCGSMPYCDSSEPYQQYARYRIIENETYQRAKNKKG